MEGSVDLGGSGHLLSGEALWDSAFTLTPLQPPQGTHS